MRPESVPHPLNLNALLKASYIVCATPRSGSSFLCEALTRSKIAGRPDEYFLHWYRADYKPQELDVYGKAACALPLADYVAKLIAERTQNGVFGVKIMQEYFEFVVTKLRSLTGSKSQSTHEVLESFFPNLHYIYVERRDKLLQAVSLAKAIQSNEWESYWHTPFIRFYKTFTGSGPRLSYDFPLISSCYDMVCSHSRLWEDYFRQSGIEPFRIDYESLVDSYDETLRQIMDQLKIPCARNWVFDKPSIKKQRNTLNDEWAARFLKDSKLQSS